MLNLMRTIPWSGGENQMKLDRMIGRISQVWRFGDMSDGISMFQQTQNHYRFIPYILFLPRSGSSCQIQTGPPWTAVAGDTAGQPHVFRNLIWCPSLSQYRKLGVGYFRVICKNIKKIVKNDFYKNDILQSIKMYQLLISYEYCSNWNPFLDLAFSYPYWINNFLAFYVPTQ